MSTPATGASSAQTPSSTPVSRNSGVSQQGSANQKAGSNQGPSMLFANLLNLMGSSDATPAGTPGQDDGLAAGIDLGGALETAALPGSTDNLAEAAPAEATANPLTAIMAWTTPANPWSNQAAPERADAPGTPPPLAGATLSALPSATPGSTPGSAPGEASAPAPAVHRDGPPSAAPIAEAAISTPLPPASATPASQLPTGMVALSQPVQADAKTLAAADAARGVRTTEYTSASTETPATPSTTDRANPNASATPGAHSGATEAPAAGARRPAQQGWRSTTTLGQQHLASTASPARTSTLDLAQQAAAQARNEAGTLGSRHAGVQADRLGADTAPALAVSISASATGGQLAGDTGGQAASGGSPGFQAMPGATSASESKQDTEATPLADGLEPEEAEVPDAYAPQNLRQVNLRLGESGEEAIDIRLSLDGEALSVDFRTDSAETRNQLQQSASSTLSDMLQRGGLQLGGVSVGAQNQGQGQGQGQGPTSNTDGGQARQASSAPSTGEQGGTREPSAANSSAPQALREDGSRPLDLFV